MDGENTQAQESLEPSIHYLQDETIFTSYEDSLQRICSPSRNNHIKFCPGFEMTGQKGDTLLRDIIRSSETVLRYDEKALTIEKEWEPSAWTYTFRSQIHSGGRKGLGGRPAGTTADVRRHFKSLLSSVIASRIITMSENGAICLSDFFDPSAIEILLDIHCKGLSNLYKGHIQELPGNLLGVHAKFTQRDSPHSRDDGAEVMIANARERHLLCLWIDRQGRARCSCIGKTIFSAKSSARQFDDACCIHAEHMYSFFDSLLPSFAANRKLMRFETLKSLANSLTFSVDGPESFQGLKGKAMFVPFKDYPDLSSCGEQWVPIRVNPKRRGALTCAFCDTRSETNCVHILEWKRYKELNPTRCSQRSYSGIEFEAVENHWVENRIDEYGEEHLGRSYLPIGPVNCPSSVRFDSELAKYVKADILQTDPSEMTYIVQAPSDCQICGCRRDEMTRKELDEGILSCTIGPVKMRVESFRCSNLACGALVYEEGRNQHIVFYSFTSAATHVFMRREIQAVVLSGGTIANRFANYLRSRLEDRYSGVLPKDAAMRGSRTLSNLFSLTLHLMVISPSPELFACSTCGVEDNESFSAVCVDGIWAGYDRASTRPLVAISELCEPIPSGRTATHRVRPNTGMFKSDAVARIFSALVKGEKQEVVNEKNLGAALTALRILKEDIYPADWNFHPIFSKVQAGTEEHQLLSSIRQITFLLFKRDTMIYRLAKSMRPHLIKKTKRHSDQTRDNASRSKNTVRKLMSEQDVISNPSIVDKIIALGEHTDNPVPVQSLVGENKVCWSDEMFTISREARSSVYEFFMLIIDGPLTQFILALDLESLTNVADMFSMSECTKLLRGQLLVMHGRHSTNIIKSNRFLMASLLSVIELQEATRKETNLFIKAIGNVLHAVVEVVSTFYRSYSAFAESEASALTYQKKWEVASPRLFRSYLLRNADLRKKARGHNDMFKSGIFLPNHPQVRPMPFNDKTDFRGRHRQYGNCSKHYDSQRPDFTPGAITFCCACSHPIIFGFKTLERGEGPRAVLDVLISRFPILPRFVVYDFACGLLRSAQHTLWWATKNTTFVSDRFHVDNHTCHKGFHPDSYNYLNGRNTVSHEQRNRPIANLKESLRNCSQSLYVSLLAYHSLYLNLKAKIRQKKDQMKQEKGTSIAKISSAKRKRTDADNEIKDEEVQTWYFDVLKFKCPCCPNQYQCVSD